jgi:hypothetical protein
MSNLPWSAGKASAIPSGPAADNRIGPAPFFSCFYENEITDPDGLGNPIPKGLFDETGYCFDVDDYDADQIQYLKDRLAEARQAAFGR